MTLLSQFAVLTLFTLSSCLTEPVVQTPLGFIKGSSRSSHGGRKYSAFEGIPYAKPPIGSLRFEPPQLIEPWLGVWDAKNSSKCLQRFRNVENRGEEDCLHLNIYIPRETPNSLDNLNVIVYIHGGGFMVGDSTSFSCPDYVMDHDVIFITFNYRLGIFGFLSTEDGVVSGNNGLKDQVMVLRWIQNNIKSFGGNPKSVTLHGISAGGASTHLHYFTKWSERLFHRGFSRSGTALDPWVLQKQPLSKAKKLAAAVGCPINNTKVMVNCLKERPSQQLINQMGIFLGYNLLPFAPFGPVIEKSEEAFLKNHPYDLLRKKKILDVPWIASHVADEGHYPTMYIENELDRVNEKWEEVAPFLLDFEYTIPRSAWASTSKKIKDFYFEETEDINQENYHKLIQLVSDRVFLVDGEKAVRMHADASNSPVYYQWFAYVGEDRGNKRFLVKHGFDSRYYYGPGYFSNDSLSPNELKMKDIVWGLLLTYSYTG